MLSLYLLLFAWFVRHKHIFGSAICMMGLMPTAVLAFIHHTAVLPTFLLGISLALALLCVQAYRWCRRGWRPRIHRWLLLLLLLFSYLLLSSGAIFLTGPRSFSIATVPASVVAEGEEIRVKVSGLFGVPMGLVSVYLFPLDAPLPNGGDEPTYPWSTADGRTTTAQSLRPLPLPARTLTTTAGMHLPKCPHGGDICMPDSNPTQGDFQVGVAVPNPFFYWRTILVMGPMLRITPPPSPTP